ncbi:hypothetical protein ACFOUV_14440 [Oceanobacillus longus]|uniref:Uncharacterized protein n=1 Tax=Oceanobacillus longus TaxID=930120 RepID=A0ABV8H3N0_9BACI
MNSAVVKNIGYVSPIQQFEQLIQNGCGVNIPCGKHKEDHYDDGTQALTSDNSIAWFVTSY